MERAQQEFILQSLKDLKTGPGCASDLDINSVLEYGYNNGSDMAEIAKSISTNILQTTMKPTSLSGIGILKGPLPSLTRVGNNSRESLAYTIDIINKRAKVLVKTPQKTSKYRDIMREYLLGVKALNPLRNIIPTVVYTLGSFTHQKKVYAVYEYINGQSVRHMLRNQQINFDKWLTIFTQLLLTLEIAQRKVGFTHFDLHSDNVLVRENQGYSVPLDDVVYTVEGDSLSPVVIDFGHSCANIDGRCVGSHEHPNHGMLCFTIPGNDMYKFIISSLHAARGGTQQKILKLFQFYEGADPYQIGCDIGHLTNATTQYCREATYSKIASHTPQEFLEWIMLRYRVKHVTQSTRTIFIPIDVPRVANPTHLYMAMAIAQQCMPRACVVPSYYISVLKKYGTVRDISHVSTALDIMAKVRLDPKMDIETLSCSFNIPIPDHIPYHILDVPITEPNKSDDITKLLAYNNAITPYLQMYYIIIELNIPELSEWSTKFRASKQFKFYTENNILIARVIRWSEVLHLAMNRNRF